MNKCPLNVDLSLLTITFSYSTHHVAYCTMYMMTQSNISLIDINETEKENE